MAFGIVAAGLGLASGIMGRKSSKRAARAAKRQAQLTAQVEGIEFEQRQEDRAFRLKQAMGATDASFAARGLQVGSISNAAINRASMRDAAREEHFDTRISALVKAGALRQGQAQARALRTSGNMSLLNAAASFIGAFQ